eukprot:CAMPEP_0116011352 /NCGR_PEP_ID=MMETSP0321-20121206/4521_1 /TAXON_ID=163516 /ORGANISM="Leptocylindrus danicus var. danicus, Strain B650" /LENGTH=684 /DNA_ID=CAMNT_0003480577 /DNA_START=65 /DNA_END=2119 /DNA_ORIENTATION=-
MGKQSRKASRKNKDKGPKEPLKTGPVSKIKSHDAKVRDATLSALSVTIFTGSGTVPTDILKAVLERAAIDTDPSASCNAAGCILNYINSVENDRIAKAHVNELIQCDVLTVILTRLKQNEDNNVCSWNLRGILLDVLCALVEHSSDIVDRISSSADAINCLTTGYLEASSTCTPANDDADAARNNCLTATSRVVHTMLDNNPILLHQLLANYQSNGNDFIKKLVALVENGVCPAKVRLHCAGSLISIYQLLQFHADLKKQYEAILSVSDLEKVIASTVLPILCQYVDYRPDIAAALISRMQEAQTAALSEENDAKVEAEIQEMIKGKNESARAIARRQKEMKDNVKEPTDEVTKTKPTAKYGTDFQQILTKAIEAWENAVHPLKLALEVATNLCTYDDQHQQNEDYTMWESDDEENMEQLAKDINAKEANLQPLQAAALFDHVVSCGLPERVRGVIQGLMQPLSVDLTDDNEVVQRDLIEVLGKCGACIGNIAINLSSWEKQLQGGNHLIEVWRTLGQCMSKVDLHGEASAEVSGAMTAMLRYRTELLGAVGQDELTLILNLLQKANCAEARQNAASMLTSLCTSPHSKEVDSLVCQHLISSIQNDPSVNVVGEVLCAIMDIYGNEEVCFGSVFNEQNVLQVLQASLPTFRNRIGGDANAFDAAVLKETALNVKRFIKYKQQQE